MNANQLITITLIVLLEGMTCAAAEQSAPSFQASSPINIGSRRELFVDHYLIDKITGAKLTLHKPIPREVAIVHDKPWEGNTCWAHTVFQDGDIFRMYYRASHYDQQTGKGTRRGTCYAESHDGIHWTKPELGLVEFEGSKKNNLVWPSSSTLYPFRDTNPACKPDEKYKAVAGDASGSATGGLYVFKSRDGIHWSPMRKRSVMLRTLPNQFDSTNAVFWDDLRRRYVLFARAARNRVRDIITATSTDFIHWTDPVWIECPGAPTEHLYHNAITPYYRAPHIYMGFPNRFIPSRKAGPGNPGVNDGLFMTSRDGRNFKRWGEAQIRPGLQKERWSNRNNYTACGILVTKSTIPGTPEELSIYNTEGYSHGNSCQLRRFTARIDGFVSVQATLRGGEFDTKPLIFAGRQLVINYSTSAAGSLRVEIQDAQRRPIDGFTLADSPEIYGDEIEQVVSWKGGSDVSKLAGKPVRLRFVLKDADVFSLRFGP